MFEHYQPEDVARRPVRPSLLAAATAGMIALAGGAIYGVAWLMSALGFQSEEPPVEITYDPFEDGTTLEDLLGREASPPPLPPLPAPPAPQPGDPPESGTATPPR